MKKLEKKTTTYFVSARISVMVQHRIEAENFDAAVAQAKTLKTTDFVDVVEGAEWFDDEYKMTGVCE